MTIDPGTRQYKPRSTRASMLALRAELAARDPRALTKSLSLALAKQHGVSETVAWRIAVEFGAPRQKRDAPRPISKEQAAGALLRADQGECISDLAREIGCSASGLHNRLTALRTRLPVLTLPPITAKSLPVATSSFLRALTKEELMQGKAGQRPRPRLSQCADSPPQPLDSPT